MIRLIELDTPEGITWDELDDDLKEQALKWSLDNYFNLYMLSNIYLNTYNYFSGVQNLIDKHGLDFSARDLGTYAHFSEKYGPVIRRIDYMGADVFNKSFTILLKSVAYHDRINILASFDEASGDFSFNFYPNLDELMRDICLGVESDILDGTGKLVDGYTLDDAIEEVDIAVAKTKRNIRKYTNAVTMFMADLKNYDDNFTKNSLDEAVYKELSKPEYRYVVASGEDGTSKKFLYIV